jgi:hypothetical protein
MHKLVYVCLVLALLPTGCDSHEAKATPTAPKVVQKSSTDDDKALCVQVFTRARACTDDYIPALVDSRAKLDTPAGIAAKVAADRAAVIAEAKQEWTQDSTDAAISGNCDQMVASLTDEDRAMSDTARSCIAKDCAGFTACITPLFEKHLHK